MAGLQVQVVVGDVVVVRVEVEVTDAKKRTRPTRHAKQSAQMRTKNFDENS